MMVENINQRCRITNNKLETTFKCQQIYEIRIVYELK